MSIEPPRDQWQPTSHFRWNLGGKLQQMWWREVSEYSTYWKRTLWKPEYEWRDVPTEQPAQETRPVPDDRWIKHEQDTSARCPHGKPVDDTEHQCRRCGPVVSG